MVSQHTSQLQSIANLLQIQICGVNKTKADIGMYGVAFGWLKTPTLECGAGFEHQGIISAPSGCPPMPLGRTLEQFFGDGQEDPTVHSSPNGRFGG